jgi:hypothetical protein
MPLVIDDKHVKIVGCTVVWDSITRPEVNDGGNTRWGVKVVVNPASPDIALLKQLADRELAESEFRGVLPNGGLMPIGTAGPQEFNGLFNGYAVLNCTTFRAPEVFDENGQRLDPMQYGSLLYSGQKVDVVVHCNAYNNKSKGVAARLDGLAIIASAQAPRIDVGGGGVDVSQAFGGGAPAPVSQPAPPSQAHNFLPGAPPPPPAPGPSAPPPPPPAAEPGYMLNGVSYTADALRASGYTDAHLAGLPRG